MRAEIPYTQFPERGVVSDIGRDLGKKLLISFSLRKASSFETRWLLPENTWRTIPLYLQEGKAIGRLHVRSTHTLAHHLANSGGLIDNDLAFSKTGSPQCVEYGRTLTFQRRLSDKDEVPAIKKANSNKIQGILFTIYY